MENRSLVFDLVDWIANTPRTYSDVMEAWKTSCPRLSVWEEATDYSFVERYLENAKGQMVRVTPAGLNFLRDECRKKIA